MIFTSDQRDALHDTLLAAAREDPRIAAIAITGSAAIPDRADRWSDIDLAFGVDTPANIQPAIDDWTAHLYDHYAAVHHQDFPFGPWLYRAFLLENTLQVDLAFVEAAEFRALAPDTFRLIKGDAREPIVTEPQSPPHGMAWLYAVHARSAIARNHAWQAEYMISALRDQAFTLACLRHGLPAAYAKGIRQLPRDLQAAFESALVRSLDPAALSQALTAAVDLYCDELQYADPQLANRLNQTLRAIAALC
jgi:hypothetical protein